MKVILIILFCVISSKVSAQDDNVLWASVKLNIVPDSKQSFAIRPFVRMHDNFTDYRSSSLDLSYQRNLSPHWTAGFLTRGWLMATGDKRVFLWPSITYKNKIGSSNFQSRLMLHHAWDVEIPDGDFVRSRNVISKSFSDKTNMAFALEPWYRLDGENKFFRMRYELAFTYKFNKEMAASLMLRKQDDIGDLPNVMHYVTTLSYNL